MQRVRVTETKGEVVEFLKRFLDTQSAAPPTLQYCRDCGAPLEFLQTQFWLVGAEQGWNIALPYCPDCHPVPAKKPCLAA